MGLRRQSPLVLGNDFEDTLRKIELSRPVELEIDETRYKRFENLNYEELIGTG